MGVFLVFKIVKGGDYLARRSRKQIHDPCHQRHKAQRPRFEKRNRKAAGGMAKEP